MMKPQGDSMVRINRGSLLFVIGMMAMSSGFLRADCSALFDDLYNYAQTPTIGNCQPNFNTLYVKMSTNRSDNRYVSYAEGYTTQKVTSTGRFPLIPSFGGTARQLFSDRSKDIYETSCNPGEFCLPVNQIFSTSLADQLGMSFVNGSVVLTLKSWGNGKFSVPLTCTPSGMMYGERDGTLFTFSFQKTVYKNGCIR